MSNTGRAAAGKVYTGRGSLVPPSFQDIGTNSGLTDHGVLIGQGTDPFVATAPGNLGQILISNGPGADPSFQSGGTSVGQTITGDDSVVLSPTAGNWNILGQDAGSVSVMDTNGSGSTLRVEDRTWTTEFVVDPSATVGLRGTYTTIQSAVTAASAGDTVFVRAGTYTENIALKTGVNITGLPTDGVRALLTAASYTPTVKVIGKMTYSDAGSMCISNIFFETNADFILQVTGTEASAVVLQNCYLNCTNNTGVSSTSTLGGTSLFNCSGSLGAVGIAFFVVSGGNNFIISGGKWSNPGSSVTNSTWTGGILTLENCEFNSFVTSSGAGSASGGFFNVYFNASSLNQTCITHGNTSADITVRNSRLSSGSASTISIGAGASGIVIDCIIGSSNTNAIAGAGTVTYGGLIFTSSSNISTTTQVIYNEGPSRTIGSANTGAANTLTVTNSSNTATSSANIVSTVGGTSSADATYQAAVAGTTTWTWGVDNSDSDAYVLAQGTALGTNNVMKVTVAGEMTKPLQPGFLAYLDGTIADVTGNGATYTLGTSAFTEVSDQNSDFNTNGTFTAPVTGLYYLQMEVGFTGLTIATAFTLNLITSNRTYQMAFVRAAGAQAARFNVSTVADMDAADTATYTVVVSGEAGNTADISGATAPITNTFVSGFLLG